MSRLAQAMRDFERRHPGWYGAAHQLWWVVIVLISVALLFVVLHFLLLHAPCQSMGTC